MHSYNLAIAMALTSILQQTYYIEDLSTIFHLLPGAIIFGTLKAVSKPDR